MTLPVSITNCASRTRPRNSEGKMLMESAVRDPSDSRRAVTPTKLFGLIVSSVVLFRWITTVSPVTSTRTGVPSRSVIMIVPAPIAVIMPSTWPAGRAPVAGDPSTAIASTMLVHNKADPFLNVNHLLIQQSVAHQSSRVGHKNPLTGPSVGPLPRSSGGPQGWGGGLGIATSERGHSPWVTRASPRGAKDYRGVRHDRGYLGSRRSTRGTCPGVVLD